jgi:membrane-bound metal-dependent hydrolase YbcI (DUF457 family)
MMDGVAGVLPDIPLVVSVVVWRKRGTRVPIDYVGYRIHRATHSVAFLLVLCGALYLTPNFRRLTGILVRHVLLDFMTHDRNWLRYGYSKFYRKQ